MMKQAKVLAPLLLLLAVLPAAVPGLTLQEDDLVFDDVGEESSSTSPTVIATHEEESARGNAHEQKWSRDSKRHPVERLWGVPDVVVPVGHVLKLRIPRQAFSGPVDYYEVHNANGGALPKWIYWDDPASTLMGVPSKKDVGSHHLSVKAIGKHGDSVRDMFVVQVVPEKHEELKHKDGKTHCNEGEEQTLLTIRLDADFEQLAPLERVSAIDNLAGFLGLHMSAFSLHPQRAKEGAGYETSVILSGPGNVAYRKSKHPSAIQWQVGCDGSLWRHQKELVNRLWEQAKDGTLAEVMQLPVLLWVVRTESSPLVRNRREAGSGDYGDPDNTNYDYEYEEDYEDDDEDGDDDNDDSQVPPTYMPDTNASGGNVLPEHPHRHHHGEETINWNTEDIDEHDIVPIVNQNGLASSPNQTTTNAPATTTATELISPPSTTSTTTTTTMPSTSTSPTTSTTTSTTQAAPSSISTTSTTAGTTTADTTSASASTSPSSPSTPTESPRAETTEEPTEKTRQLEIEPITVPPTTTPEPNTIIPSPVTTTVHATSTAATLTSTTERMETELTVGIVNTTTDEPTESSAISSTRLSTTMPTTLTTLTMTTLTPITTTVDVSTTLPTVPVTSATTTTTTFTTPQIRTSPTTTSTTTTTTTTTPTTTTTTTTEAPTTTTTPTTTTIRTTTETIEYGVRNFPPKQDRRLKKIPVTAGKPLSYIIPADTFSDLEDGDTRRLKLSLYLKGVPLKSTHWLQFNQDTQEVYGLPLENDISTWNYMLVAADSEGLNVSDQLDIHVQQHKLSRSVNHEFSIYLRIDKRSEFPTDVDWELKVIKSIAELYGDRDTRHITVRSIDIDTVDRDQAIFTWTNDSLPRSSECPKEYINDLLNVLVNRDGDPSKALRDVLSPEIRVKRVVYQGIGQCEDMNRPEVPKVSTQEPRANFPPVPRNQVDLINATVGQLLVFKVPEDTFFDAEDGSSRNMRMSLLTIDRTPIPSHEWLQFDSKNQEFYGVPMKNDVGRKEYQLVVTDREGASATDGLVVVVHPTPHMHHTVEFSMTLDIPYESFAHSALQKRNFIERLSDLYQDKDTSAISLHSISNGSTVITWHNRTLPTSYCAHEEVSRLRAVLVKSDNDRRSVTDEVLDVMGLKFPVKQITVVPMGICLGELTGVHSPDGIIIPPVDDSTSVGAFHDDYLITFVLPAVIIAAMLILAGIIACILYKRRRSGKMSVSEQDEERQSFRSKGIPVIFQDELDEKPDPGNKSPVILKEEKPPLPPPEYQKSEDGADVPMLPKENSEEPYQPPPPFATNRDSSRQNRPKPTPTYRKPPPNVTNNKESGGS